MLTIILLLLVGFIVGVALTATIALFYCGVVHAEAVRIVDTHLSGIAMPKAGPVMTMQSVV
ncbi:MAG: hypothetical protein WBL20_12800 [Sphingobium sp.]|uniref:hypothetical protein n=1 Tax=unclassified Sphingobium TaxID=2611147 RepID=UPI0003D59207|nr:hypothetical protein [Sphingobium sp. C100]ETI64591.1 hypothetical protein C100_06900 [Sphingobium sp. C100]